MKHFFQKRTYLLLILVLATMTSCKLQVKEEPVDPGKTPLYSKPFTLRTKSAIASSLLIAAFPDGSKLYLDGTKIKEYGHWMQIHDEAPDRKRDTLFSVFTPPNNNLITTWKIEDPSVLKLLKTADKGTYIIVEAMKLGSTKVFANVEKLAADTVTSIVSGVWCNDLKIIPGSLRSVAHTIYREVEDPADNARKSVTVNLEAKFLPEAQDIETLWSVDKPGVIKMTPSNKGLTCLIEPLSGTKEEIVTVTARCALRTITALISVKNNYVRTAVTSVRIVDNDLTTDVATLAMTTVQNERFLYAVAKPDGVMANYEFLWESLDPTIVKVVSSGEPNNQQLKALKAGTTKVIVKAGSDLKGWQRDTCMVTVTNAVADITLTSNKPEKVFPNSQFQLTATLLDAAAHAEFSSAIQFESLTTQYATVDNTGKVTCVAETGLDANNIPNKARIKVTVTGWPLVSKIYEFTIDKAIPPVVNMDVKGALRFTIPEYSHYMYLFATDQNVTGYPNPHIQIVLATGTNANSDQTNTAVVTGEGNTFYIDAAGVKRDDFVSGTYTKAGTTFTVTLTDGAGNVVNASGTVATIVESSE